MDSDEKVADALAQQAAEWWLMQRDGGVNSVTREAFIEWLRRSPAHVESYLTTALAARHLRDGAQVCSSDTADLVAAAKTDSVTHLADSYARLYGERVIMSELPWWRRKWMLAVAPAACAVLAIVVGFVLLDGQRFGIPRAYETEHAQQGSWPLPDGSVLHLNSNSRAVVRFGGKERLITLERGQAMFQVAKDPQRRFRVDAGTTQVVAIGTQFDIYRRDAGTRVVVVEGRVAVTRESIMPGGASLSIAGATTVDAGQQVEVKAVAPAVVARPADVRSASAWLQREIVFDDAPLGQVVEDFNRYTTVPLEIEGEELKALQISGVFGAYDLESFLAFVRRLDGVRVEQRPTKIRIYLLQTSRDGTVTEKVRVNGSSAI
jgi:transmembrane sensor